MALVAASLSLFVSSPALEVKRNFFPTIIEQGNHLLTPIRVSDESTHAAKLAFRLVPPLLVHTLHLSVESYYVLQALLGLATLAGLAWLFHQVGYTRRDAALIVGGLALTYMGAVWFLDTQPYFDAIAASVLVLALCVRQPLVVFAAGSIALWTDERSVLALGVVALFHLSRKRRDPAIAVGAALVAYLALRLFLGARYGLSTGKAEIGPRVFFDYWSAMPLAIVLSLEGLWLVLVAGYGAAWKARDWRVVAAGALTAGSIGVAMMVNDVTRSTVFALPGVVLALTYLAERDRRWMWWGLALCAVPTAAAIVTTGAVVDHVSFFKPLVARLIF